MPHRFQRDATGDQIELPEKLSKVSPFLNFAESKPTKNQKRQEARDKARALREEQSKKSKRNKVLIQSSMALGVIGVIGLVTVLIISSLRPPGPGPANMQSDGIKIGQGLIAERTPLSCPMSSLFPQRRTLMVFSPSISSSTTPAPRVHSSSPSTVSS